MKPKTTLYEIQHVLDALRPAIQSHGGDVEFVDYKDHVVYVRFLGSCVTCPLSVYTLKQGIEDHLKQEFADIKEVISVE